MRIFQLLIPIAFSCSLLAQTGLYDPFFPKPSYFRKHFAQAQSHVELQPPARLADYTVGGKLELSLKNYLDLVMSNNPDIAVQKLTVDFSRDAITRSFSTFDPLAIVRFSTAHAANQQLTVSPSGTPLSGALLLNQLTQPFSLQYSQTLQTGTQYNVLFGAGRTSSDNKFSTLNPSLNSNVNFNLLQPLIRGRGTYITRLPISIARSKLRAADYGFEDQVLQLITTSENAYWDVVSARENLRVQEESLKLADAALKRAQKELELGATSPLEIYQPEANYANAQLAVVQARYRLSQSEDALRRQMGADLSQTYQSMPIVLTEPVEPTVDVTVPDTDAAITEAMRRRPDLKNAVQNIDADDLGIRLTNDALRPDLSLTAQYGSSAIAGLPNANQNVASSLVGGFGTTLSNVFAFNYPIYGFGLNLRLPIRDRKAVADLADALVQKKIDALKQRSIEENIRLQVLTAINQIGNSRDSLKLAKVARDLAQKRVEADQKRYELGTTTLFFVLASQNDFVLAESNLLAQYINYRRNQTALLQRTGQLLEERGIVVR